MNSFIPAALSCRHLNMLEGLVAGVAPLDPRLRGRLRSGCARTREHGTPSDAIRRGSRSASQSSIIISPFIIAHLVIMVDARLFVRKIGLLPGFIPVHGAISSDFLHAFRPGFIQPLRRSRPRQPRHRQRRSQPGHCSQIEFPKHPYSPTVCRASARLARTARPGRLEATAGPGLERPALGPKQSNQADGISCLDASTALAEVRPGPLRAFVIFVRAKFAPMPNGVGRGSPHAQSGAQQSGDKYFPFLAARLGQG